MRTIYQGVRLEDDKSTAGECQVRVIRDGFVEILDPQPSLKLRNHSPDGFNWGYGGSGPAQLALAILLDFTKDESAAQYFYQEFKMKVIAKLPAEKDWHLTAIQIENWLIEQPDFANLFDRLSEMATPRPWYTLEAMGRKFIAAKPTDDHPYFKKTRNIDIAGDEDYPRKEDDIKLMISAVNMLPLLLAKIEKLENSDKALKEAHAELTRLGIDEAAWKPCDDPTCNSHIVHRIKELAKRKDDVKVIGAESGRIVSDQPNFTEVERKKNG